MTAVVVVAVGAAAVAWTASLNGSTARADFAGHADQLCDTYHQAVGDLGRPGILADVPGWAAREKPFARALAEQLDALEPPASEAQGFARFRALVRRPARAPRRAEQGRGGGQPEGIRPRRRRVAPRAHPGGRAGKQLGSSSAGASPPAHHMRAGGEAPAGGG